MAKITKKHIQLALEGVMKGFEDQRKRDLNDQQYNIFPVEPDKNRKTVTIHYRFDHGRLKPVKMIVPWNK